MSWEQGTASSAVDLLDKLNAFLLKGHSLTPAYAGAGTGLITNLIGTATSSQETITVTFTSATAFNVVGSVTGSMGSGTVGSAFTHAKVTFTITAGGTAWAAGNTIIFVMTPPWVQLRGISGDQFIWKAPGNANTNEIYVGALRFNDTGTGNYDNLYLGGWTGYTAGNTWWNQPGSINAQDGNGPILPLWSGSIPYWFVADGKRVIIVAKITTNFECAYLGFIDTYPSPGQYAYPLLVGGAMAFEPPYTPGLSSSAYRYSSAAINHTCFWKAGGDMHNGPDFYSTARLRKADGTWRGFVYGYGGLYNPGSVWPYASGFTDSRPNLDGTYLLLPIIYSESFSGGTNVFGELDGVCAVTGHSNAAENTVTIARVTWLVVQNAHLTTKADYAAVRLS